MPFFWLVVLLVATTVVSALLQKQPKDAKPAGASDFQVPTAQEGRVIPVIFGTVRDAGPNVVWWGDLSISAQKQHSGGIFGIGGKNVTTGYKYSVGMQMALGHGLVDALVGLQVGNKSVPLPDPTIAGDGHATYLLNQPNLFGGDSKEGGISGSLDFYFGSNTQLQNSYLTGQFGETAPAYRGLCYAVLRGMYVGTSQYIKNWAFVLQRCPNGLGLTSNKHKIQGPMSEVFFVGSGNGTLTGLSAGSGLFADVYAIQATDRRISR